jgi:SAM-dependent methyltransferase
MRKARAVEYDHLAAETLHTVEGAAEALSMLFPSNFPQSVLDIGCGNGSWLRAALDRGAQEIVGVDGVKLDPTLLHVPADCVHTADLSLPVDLGRCFDLVICLETAEHLEARSAKTLVDTIVRHGELILFSAAAPGQDGVHHVNLRWPAYWQKLFNDCGFACSDSVRWSLWENARIEPWYRQNMMTARRDEKLAGTEPRILPVLHPDVVAAWGRIWDDAKAIENGALPLGWYAAVPFKAALAKLRRFTSGK